MMQKTGSINVLIGERFEDICNDFIPRLLKINHDPGGSFPDFIRFNKDREIEFYLEVKVGNIGPAPKGNQIKAFKKFYKNVFYIFGYHTFDNVNKIVTQKTKWNKKKCIENNLNIKSIYIISSDIVEKLFEGHKSKILNNGVNSYHAIIRESRLLNIINGTSFNRYGMKVYPESFYGLDRTDISLKEAVSIDNVHVECGYLITKSYMKELEGFLEEIMEPQKL